MARKDISNKVMIFESDRKKQQNSAVWWKKVMSGKNSGVTTQGRKEVEVDTVLLGSDKSNGIVNKVLSYF